MAVPSATDSNNLLKAAPPIRNESAVTAKTSVKTGPLVSRRSIARCLFRGCVNLFRSQQNDGFRRNSAAGPDRQCKGRHAAIVGQIGNDVRIGFTKSIVKSF